MAITDLNPRLSTFCSSRTNPIMMTLLLILLTVNFPKLIISDSPCVYPCYPPPTGYGTTPTTPSSISTPPPPTPQTQTGTYPPPGYNNPSPNTGYYPNNPTPPNSDGGFYGGPPPPDPILPYFPFYYKHPLHRGDESPENSAGRSRVMISMTALPLCLLFSFLFISPVFLFF